jgi:hypothetical protein
MAGFAALASLLFSGPAFAQEDGVFIDPDSPSAKEYSLPLESERRQADPSQEPGASIVQGARESPIFGAGIVRAGKGEGSSRSGTRRSAADKAAERRAGAAASPQESDAKVLEAAMSNPGPPAGGIGVALIIGGVAIGVLLLGGVAGMLLRRRA